MRYIIIIALLSFGVYVAAFASNKDKAFYQLVVDLSNQQECMIDPDSDGAKDLCYEVPSKDVCFQAYEFMRKYPKSKLLLPLNGLEYCF